MKALGDSSSTSSATSWGGFQEVRQQDNVPCIPSDLTILVIGAAGFVGAHVSFVLKHCGDRVLGLDNFNRDYNLNLKHARKYFLERAGIFVIDGDINNAALLQKLFDVMSFTHMNT